MKRMAITDAAVTRSEIERNGAVHARVMRVFFWRQLGKPKALSCRCEHRVRTHRDMCKDRKIAY